MFRAFTAASILALTATAAKAGPATDAAIADPRVHQVADALCGPLLQSKHSTSLFYQKWFNSCMRTTSVETARRVEARAGRYPAFAKN